MTPRTAPRRDASILRRSGVASRLCNGSRGLMKAWISTALDARACGHYLMGGGPFLLSQPWRGLT